MGMTEVACYRIQVNRTRTTQEALGATGRVVQCPNRKVVDTMPIGEGNTAEVVLFELEPEEYTRPDHMSDADLEQALKRRGLKNDPRAVIDFFAAHPELADKMSVGTQWKDAYGYWCYTTFYCFGGRMMMDVYRSDNEWNGIRRFAGVRENPSA